jgi:sugar lactone lactonase YvrE
MSEQPPNSFLSSEVCAMRRMNQTAGLMLLVAAMCVLTISLKVPSAGGQEQAKTLAGVATAEDTAEPEFPPTHEQAAIIAIPVGEEKAAIHTFCLDADGNLLAACGGEQMTYVRGENGGEYKMIQQPSGIRVISPEGKLLETWSLEITPQAVNLGPDGRIYVAGQGRIAKLDKQGKAMITVDSPQLTELTPPPKVEDIPEEKLDEAAQQAKQAKIDKLQAQQKEMRTELTEAARKMTEAKEKGAAAEQTASTEYQQVVDRYLALREQLEALTTPPKELAKRQRVTWMRKRAVTGIAVTEQDVFVCCPAAKGYGYDVWRLDKDLANPKKIVTRLSGCCGQMDIQASGGRLFVAENGRKRVSCYDREGQRLCNWGKSDRTGVIGFGSCCNPMNLRFGADGVVYTSEASLGRIKRFTPDGKFLGLVGTAKVVPGCKHVSIGVGPNGDCVYLLDITRKQIVVMARGDGAAGSE